VSPRWQRALGGACVIASVVVLIAGTAVLIHKRDSTTGHEQAMYACSLELADVVPPDALIVVRGGHMVDGSGRPGAYNESMVFAWMDRRGFNYGAEQLSIETLDGIAKRGGRYWFVASGEIEQAGIADTARARYELVRECRGAFLLFDLTGGDTKPGPTS